MRLRPARAAAFASLLLLIGCRAERAERVELERTDTIVLTEPGQPGVAPGEPAPTAAATDEVQVELLDRNGQRVGTARITQDGEGVRIAIRASNLSAGPRGFHFHETGRCDPPAFESAGDHFSPQPREHGLENPRGPHAGDMPNLLVRADGSADTVVANPRVTLRDGAANSLLDADGTALVIHAERDDQRTDPSGDSGDRIACGVLRRG